MLFNKVPAECLEEALAEAHAQLHGAARRSPTHPPPTGGRSGRSACELLARGRGGTTPALAGSPAQLTMAGTVR